MSHARDELDELKQVLKTLASKIDAKQGSEIKRSSTVGFKIR